MAMEDLESEELAVTVAMALVEVEVEMEAMAVAAIEEVVWVGGKLSWRGI